MKVGLKSYGFIKVENELIDPNALSLLQVKTLTSYFYQDGTLVYFLLLMVAKLLLLVYSRRPPL